MPLDGAGKIFAGDFEILEGVEVETIEIFPWIGASTILFIINPWNNKIEFYLSKSD